MPDEHSPTHDHINRPQGVTQPGPIDFGSLPPSPRCRWPEVWRFVYDGQPPAVEDDPDKLIGLGAAARYAEDGERRPNPDCVGRWCREGILVGQDLDDQPVKLRLEYTHRTDRNGRTVKMTTRSAIKRFRRRRAQADNRGHCRFPFRLASFEAPPAAAAAEDAKRTRTTPSARASSRPRRDNAASKAALDAAGITFGRAA